MAELLLSVPLKTSYEVVLGDALKSMFKDEGYSKDSVSGGIEEFQRFRNQIVSKSLPKTHATLELLYRYHDQLLSLSQRLPTMKHKVLHNVTIYWDDALDKGNLFGSKANIPTSSLELERICILFNIGALQSHLAAESRADDTDEELKNCAKLYQSAASIFDSLSTTTIQGVTLTSDLKPEVLSALSALMLAQAQEVFIDKAIKDKMKDSIIAKLCVQAEDMFEDASAKLSKDVVKPLWDRTWLSNVAGKKLGYEALSHYFQSQVCGTKKLYGEQLSRLTLFLKNIRKAQEKIGNSNYMSTLVTEGDRIYKLVKKDNDFIYNEPIPAVDDLPLIDRVGSARLAKIGPIPENFSSSFSDIFESAIRKGGSGGDSADAPSLKSIINTATSSLGHYLINMANKGDSKK